MRANKVQRGFESYMSQSWDIETFETEIERTISTQKTYPRLWEKTWKVEAWWVGARVCEEIKLFDFRYRQYVQGG